MGFRSSQYSSVIKSFDHILHQMLNAELFYKRRLTGAQVKEFLCAPEHYTDRNSILKLILEREPFLSQHFSKKKLEKLSLLWIAVMGYYYKSAELLVRLGADVNEICAIDKCLHLIDHEKPKAIVVQQNSTILHVLFFMKPSRDNDRLVRLVTDHGADLQVRDCKKQTVLHLAVTNERVLMVEMLLERGADINATNSYNDTPLLLSAANNKTDELLPLLMKYGGDIFAIGYFERNILHYLPHAHGGVKSAELVRLAKVLIEKGVSLDHKDWSECQPIHIAAYNDQKELVNFFLDQGANVNALDMEGKTPLHLAAQYYATTVIEVLIKRGANIHLRSADDRCTTALHIACEYFDDEIIEELVFAGADVLAEASEAYNYTTPFALIDRKKMRNPCVKLIINAMVLKKVCQPSLELKDERIIEHYPDLWNYYQECFKAIDRLKLTKITKTCSCFQLITRSVCEIAEFMRNPNFETKFRQYDLNESVMYAGEMYHAYNRAQNHYHAILEQEDIINKAFYYMLPDIIVRKIVRYMFK